MEPSQLVSSLLAKFDFWTFSAKLRIYFRFDAESPFI
jgi:hypothetical protein